jgi:hypothetical protein
MHLLLSLRLLDRTNQTRAKWETRKSRFLKWVKLRVFSKKLLWGCSYGKFVEGRLESRRILYVPTGTGIERNRQSGGGAPSLIFAKFLPLWYVCYMQLAVPRGFCASNNRKEPVVAAVSHPVSGLGHVVVEHT